ncbi:helix-turn-helix domain-containing protein [Spirosoma oryzicola]|uniref:helix-turn-helix domain-containing protein n=1 Tax=Spirosoma oryzicola TaxID=2898794 RepID=UPI001E4CDAE4|nr:helix-turn-helix transcriptional regulator [Spirosoma oryzicola]UHG94097.1 helix-turn-helix transcriptional regulator [Spirosoma oryzicola]
MKRFKTISEFLQFRHLPRPEHPLISVFKVESVETSNLLNEPASWCCDFYCVALKRVASTQDVKLKYGQQTYDYDEGILSFVSPNQVLSLTVDPNAVQLKQSGWMLLIHPDFLWNTSLAKTIHHHDFWDYSVSEALFLSEKEEIQLVTILNTIQQECHSNLDTFSKRIIVSHLETLLNYADRFYHRQFITRDKTNHQLLEQLETWLNAYFDQDDLITKGLPAVGQIADALHVSPKYLSSLLKALTGQTAQQHIHQKLIEKAKEKLSTTDLTISEIAYELGFEHLQSFSKLFKTKTNQSPLAFRASFH